MIESGNYKIVDAIVEVNPSGMDPETNRMLKEAMLTSSESERCIDESFTTLDRADKIAELLGGKEACPGPFATTKNGEIDGGATCDLKSFGGDVRPRSMAIDGTYGKDRMEIVFDGDEYFNEQRTAKLNTIRKMTFTRTGPCK